jgi:HPt (histidine-containing phosphotransfer) domain-containing protein
LVAKLIDRRSIQRQESCSSPILFLTEMARKDYECVNNYCDGGNSALVTDESIAPNVFQQLEKATASDPAELAGLYRDYLAEARQSFAQLRSALARKDGERFRERAHYMRGSSLIVGATAVALCCANLERMGRNSEFRKAARLLDQTSAALATVEEELVRKLGASVFPAGGSAA